MSISEQISRTVVELPPTQQRAVLEFAETLRKHLDNDSVLVGDAGWLLSTQILEPEDFSDWGRSKK